jgi:hypothetical protein
VDTMELLTSNLTSPIVLAFALGALARLVKSDLELPAAVSSALSIYLLFAIGLKGGVALSETPSSEVLGPALVTLLLGVVTPLTAYAIASLRFDEPNAAALGAHYGSVSAVTFIAALAATEAAGVPGEGFLPALVALLEVPAIIVALMALNLRRGTASSWRSALLEVATGKSIVLLVGGLVIGWVAGPSGIEGIEPFFIAGFDGALTLFLLELGIVAASRASELRGSGGFLIGFGVLVPILHGAAGVVLGSLVGMSPGGAAVLGAMVASGSYIAAPAAVRIAVPEANPSLYLGASLGVTFPFNLALGIPLYIELATRLA